MIIFINGSINSGKTTIANLLVKKLPDTALVEIDSLRAMIEWMPLEQSIPLNLKNAVSLIKNFVSDGLNVVVPYPLSRKNYDYMLDNLKDFKTKIIVITLSPMLEKVITDRGSRKLAESEIKRIQYHYDIGINKPDFGEIIDNTNQTPEETLQIILGKLN